MSDRMDGPSSSLGTGEKILHYFMLNPRYQITLDLYEAEAYEAAVVVQPLIGTLVYYSNHGRYEPRLAKSWHRRTPLIWEFELRPNLQCENGEIINPISFKQSIERSLKYFANFPVPILSKLEGYGEFIKGKKEISGITTTENKLIFTFIHPVRSGLVQILSFSPFGFIAKDNLNSDSSWKDKSKFISSGPYKVTSIEIGKSYILEANASWFEPLSISAPTKIVFSQNLRDFQDIADFNIKKTDYLILDNFNLVVSHIEGLEAFKLVPEYLHTVLLGNLERGIFAHKENRKILRASINKNKKVFNWPSGNNLESKTFYPNQYFVEPKEESAGPNEDFAIDRSKFAGPIVVDGVTHEKINDLMEETFTWKIVKKSLEDLKIPYHLASNDQSTTHIVNQNYDLRIRTQSVGGGVEVWGLGVVFCSAMGVMMPDPSGRVCKMINEYENDLIDLEKFTTLFFKSVEEDSAIIPIYHRGGELFLSHNIDLSSINPTLNVIKFDQLKLQ